MLWQAADSRQQTETVRGENPMQLTMMSMKV